MKKLFFLSVLAIVFGLMSCSKESKEINSYEDESRGLVVAGAGHNELKVIDALTGSVINEDAFLSANGSALTTEVTKIAEFRDVLYLFQPEQFRIVTISAVDFKQIAIIDFSAKGYKPVDICFANATDSYIIHSNASKASLLDLTNNVLAKEIDLPSAGNSIAVSGNQVFIACTNANKISVIDTRTNTRTVDIDVAPNPLFVGIRYNGKECVAVSAGNGKIDTTQAQTEAVCSYIDVETKSILGKVNIGNTTTPAQKFYPKGLAITSRDWAFIPGQTQFMRSDVKGKVRVYLIGKYIYSSINYDIVRGELDAVKSLNGSIFVDFCDHSSGIKKRTVQLPANTSIYHALKG